MNITGNKVVSIDYELTNDSGELLDRSEDGQPLTYIQGHGSMILGLEKALEGKGVGAELNVRIAPEEAYGLRDEALVQRVSRDVFGDIDTIEPGMHFQFESPEGETVTMVTALDGDDVLLDGNHPLAGQFLNFELSVGSVREATSEELAEVRDGCSCC